MWSPTQIESRPDSSAARASARTSGQRTSRSTSGSWTPILIVRVQARRRATAAVFRTRTTRATRGAAGRRGAGPGGRRRSSPQHPLRVAGEQQAEQRERELDEHRLADRRAELQARGGGQDVEPRVDREQRGGRGGGALEPGRAAPGGQRDAGQQQREA